MDKKRQKQFGYDGLGFPIRILNAPMIKARGKWILDINYDVLRKAIFRALPEKPARLTGNEIRFIRHHMGLTLQAFGKAFGVSHAAVKKWESKGDEPTEMNWPLEKDIRLRVALHTKPKNEFRTIYEALQDVRPSDGYRHKFRAEDRRTVCAV